MQGIEFVNLLATLLLQSRFFKNKLLLNYFCVEMKKIIVAILALLYIFVSSGIAMQIHYCMGKKAGVDFYASGNDKCGKCGMKAKHGGCCNDEHKFYKLNDSHKTVSNDLSFETPVVEVFNSFPAYNSSIINDAAARAVQNHSPPNYTRPSACIMNCIFRL